MERHRGRRLAHFFFFCVPSNQLALLYYPIFDPALFLVLLMSSPIYSIYIANACGQTLPANHREGNIFFDDDQGGTWCLRHVLSHRDGKPAAGGIFFRCPFTCDGMVFAPTSDGNTVGWDGWCIVVMGWAGKYKGQGADGMGW